MANLYGSTTQAYSDPYLTVAEYKQAPTAIDYNNLVVASSDPDVQDAELANVIARASSWIDGFCNQVLTATFETEQQRARLRPDGFLTIHPNFDPLIAVTSLSYGITPTQLVSFPDMSVGWVEDHQFIMPYTTANISYSSQGPLQFGMPAIPRASVFCKYTYIAGYANTTINATANAGATSITVKSGAGIIAGSSLTIYDGKETEIITVASNYVFGATTVPLASPLSYAHAVGDAISALPPAVKQAAILATTAYLKARGDYALTMQATNSAGQVTDNSLSGNYDFALAKELLRPFVRVR
jgi:hypothetical protein